METIPSNVGTSFDVAENKFVTGLKSSVETECLSNVEVSEKIDSKFSKNCGNPNEDFNSKPVDKFSYVTVEEIAASLSKKEENDSLSLTGSCISQSISQISAITKGSFFDDLSLNALRTRKNELINSIRSHLNTSSESDVTLDDAGIISSSNVTLNEKDKDLYCSTPLRETVPLAAKFLKEWKPSFVNNDMNQINNVNVNADESIDKTKTTEYEEAFTSLHEILSSTSTDTVLELYSIKLDAYKEEDDKKFDEIFNQIDNDKKSFFDVEQDFIEEIDDKTIKVSDDTIVLNDSVIEIDSNDNTLLWNDEVDGGNIQSELKENELAISGKVEDKCETVKNKLIEIPEALVLPSEDLIIGEGEAGGDELQDEDLLLASDDEQDNVGVPKSASPVPSKELKVFISNDPDENRDNNDPNWNHLRNLGSDYERYKAVRARWRNIEIPNPKKDLTCRCRTAVKNRKIPVNERSCTDKYGKRPHSPEIEKKCAKRPRRESCTMLFDMGIKKLMNDVEYERRQIEMKQEESLNHLADIQNMEQIIAQQKRANNSYILQMKRRHFRETENLIKDFRQQLRSSTGLARQQIDALRKAGDEVRRFHEFYSNGNSGDNDKNSFVYLTETEVHEILEMEEMLNRFETFYAIPMMS